jgi:hypothetical protein
VKKRLVTGIELVEGGRMVKTRWLVGVILKRKAPKKERVSERERRSREKADSKSEKSDKEGAAPASKAYAGSEHFVALRGYEHFVALRIKGGNTERPSAQPDPLRRIRQKEFAIGPGFKIRIKKKGSRRGTCGWIESH